MKITVFQIVLSAIGLALLFSCEQKKAEQPSQVVNVGISTAKRKVQTRVIHASGRLASQQEMKLSFKTAGIIRQIYVDEGDYAHRGQILAQLNLSELQAMKQQAETARDKARRDYDRAKQLFEDSVATKEQFQNAESALKAAEAQLDIVNFNIQHSSIIAPTNGKVLKKLSEANEIVAAGYPVFLFAGTENAWVVRVGITGKNRNLVRKGDSARVEINAFPDTSFKAVVSETGIFANPYTGVFETELKLLNPPKDMATGMVAKAEIFSARKDSYVSIPVNAMLEARNNTVWIYRLKNGKTVKQAIEIEQITDREILAKKGIQEGDTVISKGALYVDSDSKLNITSVN